MKLVPAGFSKKTNRAYDAFWACPNKCKQPYPAKTPRSTPPSPVKTPPNADLSVLKAFIQAEFKVIVDKVNMLLEYNGQLDGDVRSPDDAKVIPLKPASDIKPEDLPFK